MGKGEGKGKGKGGVDEDFQACCAGTCGVLVIIGILLFALSFACVGVLEWGLDFNKISRKLDTDYKDGGRYLIGLGHKFIKFPRHYQTVSFSDEFGSNGQPIVTRTKDGLAVTVIMAFQYQLIPEELYDMYTEFNLEYERNFIRISRDTLLEVVSSYQGSDFWTKRAQIGDEMIKQLRLTLASVHCKVKGVQVLRISLPDQYENAILATQVVVQEKKTAEKQQAVIEIESETLVLTNQVDIATNIINKTAYADAQLIELKAKSRAFANLKEAEKQNYAMIKNALGLNSEDVDGYRWYSEYQKSTEPRMLVGVDANALVA